MKVLRSCVGKIDSLFIRIMLGQGLIILGMLSFLHPAISKQRSYEYMLFFQRTHWNVAKTFAHDLAPALVDGINREQFMRKAAQLQELNPWLDVLLLDQKGNIIAYLKDSELSQHENRLYQRSIELNHLHRALSYDSSPDYPIPIQSPFSPNPASQCVFSVAKIRIGDEDGYVLIPLHKSFRRMHPIYPADEWHERYILVGIILTTSFALLVYWIVTWRMKKILQVVRSVAAGEYGAQTRISGSDELAELSAGVNTMSLKIKENVEELKRIDQARRDMVANISHDLNSPLTSVRGYLSRLVDHAESLSVAQQREYQNIALSQCKHLEALIEQLLELSRLDAGRIAPNLEDFSILDLVTEELIPRTTPLSETFGIELQVRHPDRLGLVRADPVLIERVLVNLVENAIRYNKQGGWVRVAISEGDKAVVIAVEDNGPGIASEHLPRIFERFYRGDAARTTGKAGTGLGLSIASELIEKHGQKLSVQSVPEEGTRFSFELPFSKYLSNEERKG